MHLLKVKPYWDVVYIRSQFGSAMSFSLIPLTLKWPKYSTTCMLVVLYIITIVWHKNILEYGSSRKLRLMEIRCFFLKTFLIYLIFLKCLIARPESLLLLAGWYALKSSFFFWHSYNDLIFTTAFKLIFWQSDVYLIFKAWYSLQTSKTTKRSLPSHFACRENDKLFDYLFLICSKQIWEELPLQLEYSNRIPMWLCGGHGVGMLVWSHPSVSRDLNKSMNCQYFHSAAEAKLFKGFDNGFTLQL